jgi:hypothetical protein
LSGYGVAAFYPALLSQRLQGVSFVKNYFTELQQRVSETPRDFRIMASGQNLVNPNWKRFAPTKAVRKSQ